jgi:transcriptional regulator with XRE-family HTH domain
MNTTLSTGQAIRRMRQLAGMTGEQLAELAEISPAYLSRVETGKSRPSNRWVATVLKQLSAAIAKKAEEDAAEAMGIPA